MPRHREFDPQDALQTAIELFWEKGYADSSVDELVQRSGVAKYGLYGTFGTKRELFRKALARYASDRQNDIQRPLRQPDASLAAIRAFFEGAPKLITGAKHPRGCLICNTGVELGSRDAEIRAIVKDFFRELAGVMERCLARAVARRELPETTDLASLAAYLVTEFRTALMLARSGHSRREIERHLETALKVID